MIALVAIKCFFEFPSQEKCRYQEIKPLLGILISLKIRNFVDLIIPKSFALLTPSQFLQLPLIEKL
jgi:hypothetical protein